MELQLKIRNFLSIKEAELTSSSNIVFILAPNKAGKTQILYLVYTYLWSLWKKNKDKKDKLGKIFTSKAKKTFLVRNIKDLISWNCKKANIVFSLKEENLETTLEWIISKEEREDFFEDKNSEVLNSEKAPIYIAPSGLGDYYKGIWAMKKYYPSWRLVSEAITDLLEDLFIVASTEEELSEESKKFIEKFEKIFQVSYFIKDERIFLKEKGKTYGIEKTASGLKSIAWLYLIFKYNLVGDFLLLDEPEVNLHPKWIDLLVELIDFLSQRRKVFIATHSDYLIESYNKFLKKKNRTADVWIGILTPEGAKYQTFKADKENLIDTSPLNETYLDILRELFGYEI